MRFFIMEIDYSTETPPDEEGPAPRYKTQVVYQFRGDLQKENVGLESVLVDDMRRELSPLEKTDEIKLVAEVTDPLMLRVLKLWDHRCIDLDSRLFEEGKIFNDTQRRGTRRHDEEGEALDSR